MELTEYILTFFFDSWRHYFMLLALILASFVTIRVSIHETKKRKEQDKE